MAEKEAGPGSWLLFRGCEEVSDDRVNEKRKADDQFEALLLEGLVGEEAELSPADWQAIRREALAQVKNGRKTGA